VVRCVCDGICVWWDVCVMGCVCGKMCVWRDVCVEGSVCVEGCVCGVKRSKRGGSIWKE